MNIDSLGTAEVYALISETKEFLKHPTFSVPTLGKYQKEAIVTGTTNHIEYKFKIYRGNLNIKYSMHLRFIENNKHLVRLCINGSRHHNTDGTKVSPNHIHIYDFHDGYIEGKAYELDDVPFDKDDDLTVAVDKFLDFLNINK